MIIFTILLIIFLIINILFNFHLKRLLEDEKKIFNRYKENSKEEAETLSILIQDKEEEIIGLKKQITNYKRKVTNLEKKIDNKKIRKENKK